MSISTKILLYTLSTAFLTFLIGIGIVGLDAKKQALSDAHTIADGYVREYANLANTEIQSDIQTARTLSQSINAIKDINFSERQQIQNNILVEFLQQNESLLATEVNWELNSFLPQYKKQYGRRLFRYNKEGSSIKYKEIDLDLTGVDPQENYYKVKLSKNEEITNPETESYNKIDSVLKASILIPILEDSKFIGVTGIDINLERYKSLVNRMNSIEGSEAWLLANNTNIIASSRNSRVGRSFDRFFTDFYNNTDAKTKLTNGESFSIVVVENKIEYYITFAPINLGKDFKPWNLAIVIPSHLLTEKASGHLYYAIFIGFLGLGILALVIAVFSSYLNQPIQEMVNKLKLLERGIFSNENKLTVYSNDELGQVAQSVNKLIDTLHNTVTFATDIGQGKLNSQYELIGDEDALGKALLEMRTNLLQAQQYEGQRKDQERQQNWIQKGIADSGTILRQRTVDFNEFGYNIISFLVKYIDANQGGFFIVDDIDTSDIHIRLTAAYAYDKRRMRERRINMNEGLVARCVQERELIYMTNIPNNYFKITSGFGETLPTSLVLLPLIFENEVYGVAEIASFEEMNEYKIKFLEQVSERIAAFLANLKTSIRTNVLLEHSQVELGEIKKEKRFNEEQINKLIAEQKEQAQRLTQVEGLFNMANNSLGIAHYSTNGVIEHINEKYQDLYFANSEAILGRKHINVSVLGIEDPIQLSNFWEHLKDGVQQRRLEKILKDGIEFWIEEFYTPLYLKNGKFNQIISFSWDVTEYVTRERKLRELIENNNSKTEIDQS